MRFPLTLIIIIITDGLRSRVLLLRIGFCSILRSLMLPKAAGLLPWLSVSCTVGLTPVRSSVVVGLAGVCSLFVAGSVSTVGGAVFAGCLLCPGCRSSADGAGRTSSADPVS